MRSLFRRSALPVALVLSLGAAGACSSSNTTTTTPGGSTAGGTDAPSSGVDYSTLSGSINGSGSTFQASFNEEIIGALKDEAPDLTVTYGGGGSGKGKTDLQEQLVDYAGTDSLVKDEDKAKYKGGDFLYFPTVSAPITVSYNVKGVSELKLSPSTLAKIFQAEVTKWNDPAIAADNSGASLPDSNIVVVHRSDGSGTTSNFTNYLKKATPDWKLDAGDTVQWPSSTQGAQGSGGMTQAVASTEGSIAYIDYSDAKAKSLSFASIKNKSGTFVAPTLEGASAAVEKATVKDDLTYSALDTDGETAYPITSATYILVYAKQTDATKGKAVKGLLTYILNEGQGIAKEVDYAKLPDALRTKAVAQLDKIQVP